MNDTKLCMLIILDGWGISPDSKGNAVKLAQTPYLDRLENVYPNTSLLCSGEAVGLPAGIVGNSEVGHLNIGAGRVVDQALLKIDKSIKCGEFFENDVLKSVISKVKANDSALHLMGLVSDGGVHSHLSHLLALLDMAKKEELKNVYIHAILDGRDTSPDSGINYIKSLHSYMKKIDFGTIVSICGRYYAMDRDKRWDRVEKAYRLYTRGEGVKETNSVEAVQNAYNRDETDEFIQPVVITDEHRKPLKTVQDGDGVIFFNFRADRARQLAQVFTDPKFTVFNRNPFSEICNFVCLTVYDEKLSLPVAFPHVHMDELLGEVISKKGLRQLRIAETEKYAHVTYFFNGGEEKAFHLEDRCLIPSPREVPTYDLKPEMSAFELTEEVISRLQSKKYSMIILNFANMDMVGHTGILEVAIKACEAVDKCVERVVTQVKAQGGVVLITADHGNAEKMIDADGHRHTAHTLNPVSFILVDDKQQNIKLRSDGILGDIAPTILHVMNIDKPEQMTGSSLIEG